MDPIDLVRNSELFAGLQESDIRTVVEMSAVRKFERGETLFRQEESSDAFYLIGSGEVEVGAQAGEDWIHFYSLGPGDAAGIVSFFARTDHGTTARASEPTVTLMLDRGALPFLRRMPALLLSIFRSRTQRMQRLVEIEEDVQGLSRQEIQERADSLRRLIEDLEDQAAAVHNEIHRAQIRLKFYESHQAKMEVEGP